MKMTLTQAIALHDTLPTWEGSPEGWADVARCFEQNNMWAEAAEAYEKARTVTVGHNRRYRYEQAAIACRARAKEDG